MFSFAMIGQEEVIKDKINYFCNRQVRVHLTKKSSPKFPKGKFHNGKIGQVYSDFITFLDDEEGLIEILFFEIADIEKYREKNG